MSASRACPVCGEAAGREHRPFCSPRCADVDLHRWFAGRYAVPGTPAEEVDDPDA